MPIGGLAFAATAELAMTHAPLSCARGRQARTAARQMAEMGFDVLPTDAVPTEAWIAPTLLLDHAKLGAISQKPVLPSRLPVKPADYVGPDVPLLDVLASMAHRRRAYAFVGSPGAMLGLITYADLNRHPMRAAIYSLVAPLEETMVAAIGCHHPRDTWFPLLPENELSRVLTFWARAKARGIELSPIHYASLGQLTQIAVASAPIRSALRHLHFAAQPVLTGVRENLRDPVAHFGKPLVSQPGDIDVIFGLCNQLAPLVDCFTSCASSASAAPSE